MISSKTSSRRLIIYSKLKFRKWFKYGLKAQKLIAQGNGHKQHALKGQKLLAQGNALGIMAVCKAPCKGKSFKIWIIKLLPLQGALLFSVYT